jgi:hypothetical protein
MISKLRHETERDHLDRQLLYNERMVKGEFRNEEKDFTDNYLITSVALVR